MHHEFPSGVQCAGSHGEFEFVLLKVLFMRATLPIFDWFCRVVFSHSPWKALQIGKSAHHIIISYTHIYLLFILSHPTHFFLAWNISTWDTSILTRLQSEREKWDMRTDLYTQMFVIPAFFSFSQVQAEVKEIKGQVLLTRRVKVTLDGFSF